MRRMLSLGMATSGAGGARHRLPPDAGPSLLFDAKTGQVIESENPFARWYPASLTKLMTTYAAFRAVEAGEVTLQSPVRVSRNAANEPPSKMGYPVGTDPDARQCAEDHHGEVGERRRHLDRRKPRRLGRGLGGAHERRIAAARHDRLALGQRTRPA